MRGESGNALLVLADKGPNEGGSGNPPSYNAPFYSADNGTVTLPVGNALFYSADKKTDEGGMVS